MPLSLRDLWGSITSRPSRKHLARQLAAERQRSARLRERVDALEATKAALLEGVETLRERAGRAERQRQDLADTIVAKDLVGLVNS